MVKVLSFNVGYFLGFRAQRRWIRRPHRLLLANRVTESNGMDSLVELVAGEQPDVVAVQEVDLGSFRSRTKNQVNELVHRLNEHGLDYSYKADNKYDSRTLVGDLPILRHMGNMVLWQSGSAHTRYLSSGTKRLVHIVERTESPNVISVHLSKTRDTRLDQLEELVEIVKEFEPAILTGDFNVKQDEDFEVLTESTTLELHKPGKSFSTAYPTYAFDVFLTPSTMEANRCETISDVIFSDHLPVVFEGEWPSGGMAQR